ncbi:MAG: hypothetical protein HY782_07125 [Chloroflexi bacterium]|nr:hypothetical protein [Chloroflexota bacterium]
MRTIAALMAALLITLIIGSCAPEPTRVAPVTSTRPSPTTLMPTLAVGSPAPAPEIATPTPSTVARGAATETPLPTSTPAPPTPVIPPGLYVTYMNVTPNPPVRGAELVFAVGFANTTGKVHTFRWIVYIYRPENQRNSFGETTVATTNAPLGAQEVRGLGYWRIQLGGPCEDFIARVSWLDQDNRAAQFKQPNGQPFEQKLTVCPP